MAVEIIFFQEMQRGVMTLKRKIENDLHVESRTGPELAHIPGLGSEWRPGVWRGKDVCWEMISPLWRTQKTFYSKRGIRNFYTYKPLVEV